MTVAPRRFEYLHAARVRVDRLRCRIRASSRNRRLSPRSEVVSHGPHSNASRIDAPGEMLLEEFLSPMGLTERELVDGIRVPDQRVNELVNGRRGVTPHTALRLAKFFGTSPDVWMRLQLRRELYHAQRDESTELDRIKRVEVG